VENERKSRVFEPDCLDEIDIALFKSEGKELIELVNTMEESQQTTVIMDDFGSDMTTEYISTSLSPADFELDNEFKAERYCFTDEVIREVYVVLFSSHHILNLSLIL
jgi:hypothetical protein